MEPTPSTPLTPGGHPIPRYDEPRHAIFYKSELTPVWRVFLRGSPYAWAEIDRTSDGRWKTVFHQHGLVTRAPLNVDSLCQAAFDAAYVLGYRHPDLPVEGA
jgi:hypothetical protein